VAIFSDDLFVWIQFSQLVWTGWTAHHAPRDGAFVNGPSTYTTSSPALRVVTILDFLFNIQPFQKKLFVRSLKDSLDSIDIKMSDSAPSPDHQDTHQTQKRKASQAGFDGPTQPRAVKRRASKACQCCRARKVRCNVTEHGAPCTNCRLDEVECIVSESRRKKSVTKVSVMSYRDVHGFVGMFPLVRSRCSPANHHPKVTNILTRKQEME